MSHHLIAVAALLSMADFAFGAPAREDGLEQWRRIESVLTHARCLNCHTSTDYPRQGDDRHRHAFEVVRGADGHGAAAAQCAMCHHDVNADAAGVPGAKGWRLAPPAMSWERAPGIPMTSHELCRTLTDKRRNGGRSAAQLIEHHADEPLVRWAWSPGHHPDGTPRATPPLSQVDFVTATRIWAAAGAPCPQ
ncbi:MAG TPA: hypothetical protein VFV25_12305 [Methylibium sp.]